MRWPVNTADGEHGGVIHCARERDVGIQCREQRPSGPGGFPLYDPDSEVLMDRYISEPHQHELGYALRRAGRADPGETGSEIAVGVVGGAAQLAAAYEIGHPGLGCVEAKAEPDLSIDKHLPITPEPRSGPQGRRSRPWRAVRPWVLDIRGTIFPGEPSPTTYRRCRQQR